MDRFASDRSRHAAAPVAPVPAASAGDDGSALPANGWVALLTSAQGFGIVELILGPGGEPADFRYVATNAAFDRASGSYWATGRPASELLEGYRSPWLQGFVRVVTTGEPWRYEMNWDAQIYRAEVLRVGPDRAAILFSNITELRERERDLALALEHFESTELAAGTGSFRWDVRAGRFDRSAGAIVLMGQQPAPQPTPQAWLDQLHPDDRPGSLAGLLLRLAEFESSGQPWEPRLLLPHGATRWISVRARLLRDAADEVTHVDGQLTDITARRESEVRLAESERRFRDLSDHAPVIIWATGPDREIQFLNQAWTAFSGLDAAGDWFSKVHPDDRDRVVAAFQRAAAARGPFGAEARVLRSDGEYRRLRIEATARLADDGEYVGHVGVAVDETDQRRAVRDSQAAMRAAEQANRLKSEFLAVMSHELRTPLNAVIGYSELLLMPGERSLTEEQQGDVREIAAAGHRLLSLVNDVLDLSRIEAGEWTLDAELVDVALVISAAISEIAPLAARKRLAVDVDCPPGVPMLETDQRALHQVLINLLGNAVKFTEVGRISVTARVEGESVSVAIADTGIGISPDLLPLIFEPFRQGDASASRRYAGSGLGLAIVRRLTRLMGGSVDAESTPGVGSTFTVRLPLRGSSSNGTG